MECSRASFGLGGISDLNYAEITYNPPYTPEDVYQIESAAAARWGFNGVHLAITDHDEFAGNLALLRGRPDLNGRIAIGEELSLWYQGHLFHLGLSGLPESGIDETHVEFNRPPAADATTNCLKPSPPAAAWSS